MPAIKILNAEVLDSLYSNNTSLLRLKVDEAKVAAVQCLSPFHGPHLHHTHRHMKQRLGDVSSAALLFVLWFESAQLARQVQQERIQMELQY